MDSTTTPQHSARWTWLTALVTAFMVAIDTLVVTTALPVIRTDLKASLQDLEWVVNAYTLTFAVLLLTGAALGDRFGRRKVFSAALVLFTLASAWAAMSTGTEMLIAARAVQGIGAAAILPLSLTLLASVVSPERRGRAFGLWGAMVGLGISLGPVIGGSITELFSWQWIFWVNVPIGLLLLPVALLVRESRGGAGRLDPVGNALAIIGLFGVVLGLVEGNSRGWDSGLVLTGLVGGAIVFLIFLLWEVRAAAPMVPLSLFRDRGFSLTMVVTLVMAFGLYGAVFLGIQFLQFVLGYDALEAGVRTLPWTAVPMIAAPISGRLTDKIGGKPLIVLGLVLQAIGVGWIGAVSAPDMAYSSLVLPFIITGFGQGMFLAPIARLSIGFAPTALEGVASGTSNAVRQFGTVLGVSVAGAFLAHHGGFESRASFADGLVTTYVVGAIVLAVGALIALAIPNTFAGHEGAAAPGAKHEAASAVN